MCINIFRGDICLNGQFNVCNIVIIILIIFLFRSLWLHIRSCYCPFLYLYIIYFEISNYLKLFNWIPYTLPHPGLPHTSTAHHHGGPVWAFTLNIRLHTDTFTVTYWHYHCYRMIVSLYYYCHKPMLSLSYNDIINVLMTLSLHQLKLNMCQWKGKLFWAFSLCF